MAVNKVIYNGETLIDLTEDTVNEDSLLEGFIAHTPSGRKIVGTLKVVKSINGKTGIISKLEVSDIDELVDLLASKQASLIPGANIAIAEDGKTISAIFTETDPTVPSWAKQASKPTYTASEIGLGNVGNFKAVSTEASQGLSDTEKSNARTNIGAGTSSFSGNYNDLSNKPTIPTNTNQLTNGAGYTTNKGTVTSISVKMNGSSKGTVTSSGEIDLGTVITAHQSLSSYATTSSVTTKLNRTDNVNAANTSYGTYMARGEALFSSDTNPTANGTIAWTYK